MFIKVNNSALRILLINEHESKRVWPELICLWQTKVPIYHLTNNFHYEVMPLKLYMIDRGVESYENAKDF